MNDFVCPECGANLIRGRHDFSAHALSHWGVGLRGLDRLPNSEAQRRYRAIVEAGADPEPEQPQETPVTGDINVIEGDL